MNIDKYLYEIIENYKNTNSKEEQLEIFKGFCSSIWGSQNKRRIYTKAIKFKVRSDLLATEIGQIFNTWSDVNYIGYKTMTKDTDWCSLIRQKINNLYTRYFDKEVVLNTDYMTLLGTPKRLYYRWINGEEMEADKLTDIIEDSVYKAAELKSIYQKQKMVLSWDEYKEVVENFLQRIFNNCEPIEDYEVKNLTNNLIYDFYNEDNSYIKYFCDSLEYYMLNYQKEYYELKRGRNKKYKHCKECGALIEKTNNRVMYCKECYKKINESDAINRMRKYRKNKKEKCVTF